MAATEREISAEEKKARSIWNASKSLQAEFFNDFDTYYAYQTANSAGQCRILGGSVKTEGDHKS